MARRVMEVNKKESKPVNDRLIIRDVRLEELDEAARLLRDAYAEYEQFLPPERWQFYVEDMMDVRGRLSVSELIVAELDGRLVGAVTFYPDASLSLFEDWPRGWASVRLLAVHPSYRGRGIGRALMEECLRRCRERKIAAIGLHTTRIMKPARRMYERMGFERAPEHDFRPGPGVLVMAYSLQL